DSGETCDPAVVDGEGNVGVSWLSGNGGTFSYLRADGSDATAVTDGNNDTLLFLAPRASGFILLSHVWHPRCYFMRELTPDARPGPAIFFPAPDPDEARMVTPNPRGGYVEVRETDDGKGPGAA